MHMKSMKSMVILATLALLVSISAFARSKNERNVVISDNIQIGSTQLKAGTYKVEWQGAASALQVSFMRDGKVVATTQAKMVEKKNEFPSDEIITANVDKTRRLEEIGFGGKKEALVFATNQTVMK